MEKWKGCRRMTMKISGKSEWNGRVIWMGESDTRLAATAFRYVNPLMIFIE